MAKNGGKPRPVWSWQVIGGAVLLVLTVVGVVTGYVQRASIPGIGELIFGKPSPSPGTPPTTERPAPPMAPCFGASWGRPSGGPAPGCVCGTALVVIDPTTTRGVPDHGIRINYETNPICRGQSVRDPRNYVDWGDGQGLVPLVDFAGCPTHVYDRPGTYRIQVAVSGVCFDRGAANCENRCDALGSAVAEISR